MKKTVLCLLFPMALALLSCGGDNKPKNEAPPKEDTEKAEVVQADGTVTYRPDTALVFHDGAIDEGSAFIVISKKELRLFVYGTVGGDTTLIARYPVCLSRNKGQKQKSGDMRTPESAPGEPFVITKIVDASFWMHDFGDGRGEILAYGDWFMQLKTGFNGIGIHGSTNNEDKLPGRDSEGCIRLRNSDLNHLKEHYARVGMEVTIKTEDGGNLPFEENAKKGQGHKI